MAFGERHGELAEFSRVAPATVSTHVTSTNKMCLHPDNETI